MDSCGEDKRCEETANTHISLSLSKKMSDCFLVAVAKCKQEHPDDGIIGWNEDNDGVVSVIEEKDTQIVTIMDDSSNGQVVTIVDQNQNHEWYNGQVIQITDNNIIMIMDDDNNGESILIMDDGQQQQGPIMIMDDDNNGEMIEIVDDTTTTPRRQAMDDESLMARIQQTYLLAQRVKYTYDRMAQGDYRPTRKWHF